MVWGDDGYADPWLDVCRNEASIPKASMIATSIDEAMKPYQNAKLYFAKTALLVGQESLRQSYALPPRPLLPPHNRTFPVALAV